VFNAPLLKQTNYLAKFGTFQNDDKKKTMKTNQVITKIKKPIFR